MMASHIGSMATSQDGYQRVRITGKLSSQKGLHVDLGSSAMRCAYFYNYGDHMLNHMIIQNDPQLTDDGEGIEGREMEHAVDIYPFADGQPGQVIYPGNVPYHNRRAVSAKYAFYPLVGMTDEMFDQYNLAKELHWHAVSDPTFKTRLEQGIDALLLDVFQRAKVVILRWGDGSCKGIDTLTATIPAQWNIDFEKYYGGRLHHAFLKVFEYPVKNILFHTEAQAGLQYMLYQDDVQAKCDRAGLGDLMSIGDESNVVLLFDVGGHATNSAFMSVCRDKDQKPFLLELEKDVGASGGTRAWEHEILQMIKEQAFIQTRMPMPASIENDLRYCFYKIKTNIRENKPTTLYANRCGSYPHEFELTWDQTFQAWEKAFYPTMILIREQMNKLKVLRKNCEVAKIIVSGGSSRHRIFRDFLQSACRVLEVGIQPFYMNRIGRGHEYARLALGASYATTQSPSVKEFLTSASFGLRVKATWKTDDGKPMYDWSKDVLLMWSEAEGSVDVYNTSTEGEEAEIVCQANFAAPKRSLYLPRRKPKYQILRLPHLPRGKIHFRLVLNSEEEEMTLILMGEIPMTLGSRGMGEPEYPMLASATFPVTVWPGCRALTIYDDQEEITAKVNNLLIIAKANYVRVRRRMATLTDEEARQLLDAPGPENANWALAQDRGEEVDEEMADA